MKGDVSWIKISTSIFDDEKIRLIEGMPERDAIFYIWIRLLVLAGKVNDGGTIYVSETVPYTDEMLATVFNRPLTVVRLALQVFERFGMIELLGDQRIFIIKWEKHQNIEGMEKIRLQTAERVAKHRKKIKLLECNVTVTQGNAIEENKKRINLLSSSEDGISTSHVLEKEILIYLNERTGRTFKFTKSNLSHIHARMQEGFSMNDFKNVISAKVEEWGPKTDMRQYLRPATLFGTKFESYVQAIKPSKIPDRLKRFCPDCKTEIIGTSTICGNCGRSA